MKSSVLRTVLLAATLALSSVLTAPVARADAASDWASLVAQANGESLNLILQPDTGYEEVVDAFRKKFPHIKVNATLMNPSDAGPRILTEQQNGIYAWDAWWGTASNMNNVVLPAHGLEDIRPYLVLPEVKDPSNWRKPDALYTDPAHPDVFVHTDFLMSLGVINTKLVPGGANFTLDQILDPSLKGRISIRLPNRPHGGTMMLAVIAKDKGIGEVRDILTQMSPTYVDNDRQNFMLVSHGGSAIGLGIPETILFECHRYGGCKDLLQMPIYFMHSRGVSVPKNPPHPAAAKVWVNWLLSREGQTEYVKDWAKHNPSGAFSLRKDVQGDPSQISTMPDLDHVDKYVAVSMNSGQREIRQVIKLYHEVSNGK
jgi:iron(III) transport system substrate-binding protein